jgi:hypothetical protein
MLEPARSHMNYYEGTGLVVEAVNTVDSPDLLRRWGSTK